MSVLETVRAAWLKVKNHATRADRTDPALRYEWPDPTPMEVPVQIEPAPNTLAKLLAESRLAQAQALALQEIEETFEEADDFDVDDFQGALEYGKTKWEIAADAAAMTPHELFERLYGVPHAQAYPPPPPPEPQTSPSVKQKGRTSPHQQEIDGE